MIVCRLRSLLGRIEEEKQIKVTYDELAQASNSTRQTISKLARNESTRLTLDQFDQILKKLNSFGYHFGISDLMEFVEEDEQGQLLALAA